MDQFVAACPTFEECLLNWVIQTYQLIWICEEPTFRDLCLSLNKVCPIISREKLGTLIEYNYIKVQQKMTAILAERYVAITTDSWTSIAHHNYITCTAHFVEKKTWQLHSLVLGIFKKNGTSNAVDTVA